MKRNILLFAAILFSTTTFCQMKIYKGNIKGIEFKYPANWIIETDYDDDIKGYSQVTVTSPYLLNFQVSISTDYSTLDSLVMKTSKKYKKAVISNYKEGEILINGKTAKWIGIIEKNGQFNYDYQYIIKEKNKAYYINIVGFNKNAKKNKSENESMMIEMVKSFKILSN